MTVGTSAWEDVPTKTPQGGWEDVPESTLGSKLKTGVEWLGTQFTKAGTGLAGAPADLQALGQKGADYLLHQATGRDFNTPAPTMPGSADLNKVIFKDIGLPEVNAADHPAAMVGNVNVGKFIDLIPQAAVSARALGQAILPTATAAIASEGAGQATAGTPYEIPARLAAAIPGQMLGQRLATPLPANLTPEQARLVGIAQQEGVPLTVGQETGRLRGVESALARFPTSAGQFQNAGERQALAINRAALDTLEAPAGINRVDPNSMDAVFAAKNAEFNAAKNAMGPVQLTPTFYNTAQQHVGNYLANNPLTSIVPTVERRMADFFDPQLLRSGQAIPELSGAQYQQFRKGLNDAAMATSDPAARRTLQGMRNALDDAAVASSTPQAAQDFANARQNWANLKLVARAAANSTVEGRGAGNLTPNALTSAVRQRQGPDVYSRTQGGLNDVSRMAGYLSDTRPNSGTPQALQMQNLLTGGLLTSGGGATGLMVGGPVGAAIGGAASLAAPNVLARILTGARGAGWLRDYLANQNLANQTMQQRLAQALIGAGAGR